VIDVGDDAKVPRMTQFHDGKLTCVYSTAQTDLWEMADQEPSSKIKEPRAKKDQPGIRNVEHRIGNLQFAIRNEEGQMWSISLHLEATLFLGLVILSLARSEEKNLIRA
jgi:hypothetical protein